MSRIYLDHASLTPIDKGVMKEMKKYSSGEFSNPSSLYASGIKAKKAVEDAKIRIAKVLHAHPDEILFTSGGTESNSLVFRKFLDKKIIISAIEHSSIIRDEAKGENVIKVPVNADGIVDLEFLKENISADTAIVSIMMVNNEIGSIQPIHDIVKIVRDANKKFGTNILVHTDACQAPAHLDLYVEKLGVDLMSLDGHKMYGPRGVGMLYVKRGSLKIERAGTENVPGIMGLTYAIELIEKKREKETARIAELRDFFIKELKAINHEIKVNGNLESSVPNILNVSIPNIDSEFFILQLDAKGIECSTKSACLRDEDESYVLKAIGGNSHNSVRFSFGRETSKGDLKKVLRVISVIINNRNK